MKIKTAEYILLFFDKSKIFTNLKINKDGTKNNKE
jgi:hypothetical protein